MRRVAFILSLSLCFLGCSRTKKPANSTCELEVVNQANRDIENCWVSAGVGEIDVGYLIPKARKIHGDFPSTPGAAVNVRWKFLNDPKIMASENVLGRGLIANEKIQIFVGEKEASTSKTGE